MSSASNDDWVWIDPAVLRAVHEEQILEHGGPGGIRDAGLFESAVARPRQLATYGTPDLAALAAAYGYGIARNNPFVDGNKRTSFVAVELFLELNGHELAVSDEACVMAVLQLAGGQWSEDEFAGWVRSHLRAVG